MINGSKNNIREYLKVTNADTETLNRWSIDKETNMEKIRHVLR